MLKLLEKFFMWWDAWTAPSIRFLAYNVTPRQGRYAIGRKLLRQLERRSDWPMQSTLGRRP